VTLDFTIQTNIKTIVCDRRGKSTVAADYERLMRELDVLDTPLEPSHPEPVFWLDEMHHATPDTWRKHLELSDMKQRALAAAISNNVTPFPKPPGKVLHIDNSGVNLDPSGKTKTPARVLQYKVYTGDVYLCDIECDEYAVTDHMLGPAQFSMHMSMMKAFNDMTAQQLKHHCSLNNPYALHVQSAREHDGNLVDAVLPPRHASIRFVLMGAAR
jgi:hypothetical protein